MGAKVRNLAAILSRGMPFSPNMASAEEKFASSTGPRQPTHGMPSSGQRASHPATVSGPQQTFDFSMRRQLFSSILHSVQTGYSGKMGGSPFNRLDTADRNCPFSMGQPVRFRSTLTTSRRERGGRLSYWAP